MRSKTSNSFTGSTSRPGLFEHLAADRVLQRFAEFQRAAGQRPPAFQRLLAALRHQDAVAPEDDRAHPDQRPLRIPAVRLRDQYAPFTSRRARWTTPPAVMNSVWPSDFAEAAVRTPGSRISMRVEQLAFGAVDEDPLGGDVEVALLVPFGCRRARRRFSRSARARWKARRSCPDRRRARCARPNSRRRACGRWAKARRRSAGRRASPPASSGPSAGCDRRRRNRARGGPPARRTRDR